MRHALLVLLAALLGLALAPYPDSPASASCVGPSFVDDRIVLERGAEQSVEGQWFHDGCADTGSCSAVLGCQSCEYDDPESPSQDVELRIAQRGRSWALGTVDAADSGRVTWTFDLPAGIRPGHARLLADGAQPVVVRVR
jgi:hypothetical protein